MIRELVGKAILVLMSAIFGVFIGNEFNWSLAAPGWMGGVVSVVSTVGIAWFLLSDSKPKRK